MTHTPTFPLNPVADAWVWQIGRSEEERARLLGVQSLQYPKAETPTRTAPQIATATTP